MYEFLFSPSPFELTNCSSNKSVSKGTEPPVCWLTECANFCFCRSARSRSRAKRSCSKSSSAFGVSGVFAVQSTSSSSKQ